MTAGAGDVSEDLPRQGFMLGPSPVDRVTARLTFACRNKDHETIDRSLKRWACASPDDQDLAAASTALRKVENLEISASIARMAWVLDPTDPEKQDEIIHCAVKASRPYLMPPHWMRDVMWDTAKLKNFITNGDMLGAKAFLDQPNLAGHRYYMPEFRALRHFVRFNVDPEYRNSFIKNCVIVLPIIQTPHPETGLDWNAAILEDLIGAAKWSEKTDTVVPAKGLSAYPSQAEKRLRAGLISNKDLPDSLRAWQKLIESRCVSFWAHLIERDLTQDLYGISAERAAEGQCSITYHVNEILAGPVIGPHYHSGTQGYHNAAFPFISAVFYPQTISEAPETKAGYLELGRPNFATPFEPKTLTIRPVAGNLVMFPAFAFHSVIPIEESPRYSVNINLNIRRKGTEGGSIMGFFE